jgi:putative transcriptional regulator
MATESTSLKGQLILDGGKLRGSCFHRSVLLVCQHDAQGAFGLVLNREAGAELASSVTSPLPQDVGGLPLMSGGPVEARALSFLHSSSVLLNANVMPNVSLGHSVEELADIGESLSPGQRIKVFAGYAGWSPGQLDGEVEQGAWIAYPASVELVFDTPVDRLWPLILSKLGWEYQLLANRPEDPSWN